MRGKEEPEQSISSYLAEEEAQVRMSQRRAWLAPQGLLDERCRWALPGLCKELMAQGQAHISNHKSSLVWK